MNGVLRLSGSSNQADRPPPGELEGEKELKKIEKVEDAKFTELLKRSSDVLFKAESVFPFDLFPTQVIVSIHKVDVVYNSFFTKRIHPVYVQNIVDVYVSRGFMFSSLHIIDVGFTGNTLEVSKLKNNDAMEAMKIIQGLVVSVKQRIDLTRVDKTNFVDKMKTLAAPAGSY